MVFFGAKERAKRETSEEFHKTIHNPFIFPSPHSYTFHRLVLGPPINFVALII